MKVQYELELHMTGEDGQVVETVSCAKDSVLPDMAIVEGQIISIGFRELPAEYPPTIEFTVDYFLLFDPVDEEAFYHIHFIPTKISRLSEDVPGVDLGLGFLNAIKQDRDWSWNIVNI